MVQPVGVSHRPAFVHEMSAVARPDPSLVVGLLRVSGLAAAVSDELDALGLRAAVPASLAPPLVSGARAVGPALTLRYLPERFTPERARSEQSTGRLGNSALAGAVRSGDVAVIDGRGVADASLFGGLAAADAHKAGIAAVLVDGAIRDIDEITAVGLPVWASARTPTTGRYRMEAVELGGWIAFCGVQVRPGDVVVADDSGMCFVPSDVFSTLARAVLDTAGQ